MPAVEAARRALRRLDTDEVPPSLRKVASSSARTLPPPLMATMISELDSSVWLRAKALDELDPYSGHDRGRRASYLFLHRPEGWEEELTMIEIELSMDRAERGLEQVSRERDKLAERVRALENEVAGERARADDAARRGREEAEERAEGLRRRMTELEGDLNRARQEKGQVVAELSQALQSLTQADARIGELKEALHRERRRERETSPGGEWGFGRGSPLEIARTLDHLATVLTSKSSAPQAEPSRLSIRFPSGLRPDRAESIQWLKSQRSGVRLLIDGYNIAHLLTPGAVPPARKKLEYSLAGLRRQAEGPISVTLFWDSDNDHHRQRHLGIDVAYVPDADDAIVAAVVPGATVVVTDDRELRERAGEAGAICLWGLALAGWIQNGAR